MNQNWNFNETRNIGNETNQKIKKSKLSRQRIRKITRDQDPPAEKKILKARRQIFPLGHYTRNPGGIKNYDLTPFNNSPPIRINTSQNRAYTGSVSTTK